MSLSAPIKCSLPTSTSITVCNGFHTCCLSTQETKNSSHDRLLMSVLQQQKVTWQLICQWRRTYKLSCDVTTTYAKIQQSQIRIETIWWNSPTVWLHDFQSRRDDQVEPWKLHWINPPHLSEMKRKGNPGDLSAGGVWFRSGSLLKYSAFKSGICGFSPSPWSRWKWCILNCREAPCSIVVMFLLWHISSSRLTKHEKVNWPLRRGLRVHERGRFLPEWTMLGEKIVFLITSVCALQIGASNSSKKIKIKSSLAIYNSVLIKIGIVFKT